MRSLGMFDRVGIPSLNLTAILNSLFYIKHPLMLDGTCRKVAAEDPDADKRRILRRMSTHCYSAFKSPNFESFAKVSSVC